MDDRVPDDLIEIDDSQIDPDEIIRQIRERIAARRAELGSGDRSLPGFGMTAYRGAPDDVAFDPDLHYHLRLANETYNEAEADVQLAPSPVTAIPILGRLWGLVRREAHNLVLYYVNRALAHQTDVNRHLVSVLNQLTALVEEQQRANRALRDEVEALHSRDGDRA